MTARRRAHVAPAVATPTPPSPRTVLDSAISEKQFQAQIVQLARLNRWLVFHAYDSRHSEPGFPDLVLVRDGHLILAELKTERGRVSAAQQAWLEALADVTRATWRSGAPDGAVSVYVWRPSQWAQIEGVLARKGAA